MKLQPRRGIAGKVVLVTGASSGIGEAAARAFASAGARVVLAARRLARLERLAAEIEAAGGEALAVATDLLQGAQISHLVQAALARFGRLDVLANIAGWGRYDWIEELSPQDLRRQFDVNVVGTAELTRQVVPVMQRQRAGHILIMVSYASRVAVPPMTVYASTKYALEGLSDGLRRELAPWGIHVSRIHPSAVPGTEFNRQAGQGGGIRYRSLPLGRVSKAEVAECLLRLVERPKRERFVGRLYALAAFTNRYWPGLIDAGSAWWVRRKRRAALAGPNGGGLMPLGVRRARGLLPAPLSLGVVRFALVGLAAAAWVAYRGRPARPRPSSRP